MNIDWKNPGFALMPTAGSIRLDYDGEKWSDLQIMREETISLHIGAHALHYGQACFEGLEAFSLKDGGLGLFRPKMNARRMIQSAERICKIPPPEELFVEACLRAVERELRRFSYGSRGSTQNMPPHLLRSLRLTQFSGAIDQFELG